MNLLQYCFCFDFFFFGCPAWGILAPRPGIQSAHPALEGEVLTTGLPGKSLHCSFNLHLLITNDDESTLLNLRLSFTSTPNPLLYLLSL